MWIVRLALRRTYTFVVLAILIAVLGGIAIFRMPTDILPDIDIPVVSVIWQYRGLAAEDMAYRVTTPSERSLTTTVSDIEHIESQTLTGISVIKVHFHPGTRVEAAVAQITAICQTVLRQMPPGMNPPLILRYNASSVPILQLGLGGRGLSEQMLYDFAANFVRTQLATVQGASVMMPAGGKPRQIMVDLDPKALYARGLSPADVSSAINAQNLVFPTGTAKIGDSEYSVRLNSSPEVLDVLNDIPVRSGTPTIHVRDVARVYDGSASQLNIVRQDGRRGTMISILKSGKASTLEIISRVKSRLPQILAGLPPELDVRLLLDQSIFVRASIRSVLQEGAMAATLTALMIMLFLGSWRSTLIVSISIPLSILSSLIVLNLLGETINVMTLGGMALAIGILVDDATVEMENIHRNLSQGKSLVRGILDGARQIAVPAFVSTLSICIVFVPVVLLKGTAKYLFQPLAMAVVFAMLASYFLSRTLVPTMAKYLLRKELDLYRTQESKAGQGWIWRTHLRFNGRFERFKAGYMRSLQWALTHRAVVVAVFVAGCGVSAALATRLGMDFFPRVDSGQMRLHVRAPAGTRIESTEQIFAQVEAKIRRLIPPEHLDTMIDNIGLPVLPINLAYSDSATIGSSDGEILISLKRERPRGVTWRYEELLRKELPKAFPGITFFYQSADMVSQIVNFGVPSPINMQVVGPNIEANLPVARQIEKRLSLVPGAVDIYTHQTFTSPELRVNVDRVKAGQAGLTERDVAQSLLISLNSSGQVFPNYWVNPVNKVSYLVAVQTPEYRMDSLDAIRTVPLSSPGGRTPQLLGNLAGFDRGYANQVISHYNIQPVIDIYASVANRDLGGVAQEVRRIQSDAERKLPRGTTIALRGQMETMRSSFTGLAAGLILAIAFVYLLMAVNFQSWLDPLLILMALPGAFSGIVWMLYVSQTSINVPALMGAIMSVGVATANSILLVTFANDRRAEGAGGFQAASDAGATRLRPVLMTAIAMILGMLPMSVGLGEGGEQNAPIGRAVIGGLIFATLATLYFVPVAYSWFKRHPQVLSVEEDSELLS